jgi:hypothetical protein
MPADEFRSLGHALVDQIAEFYDSLGSRELTREARPADIRKLLGTDELPEQGADAGELLAEVAPLLFDHSLHDGHPKFLGYIMSSAAPLGALADLLAASVNANVVKWDLSPVASEIESQTIHWLADLIGYEGNCAGLMVSGGNMANFLAFVAARTAKAPWNLRAEGNYGDERRLTVYVSKETHTWVQKVPKAGCALTACAPGSPRTVLPGDCRSLSLQRRAVSVPVSLTLFVRWLISARKRTSGCMPMGPTARLRRCCRMHPMICMPCRWRTLWRWIRTSGCTARSKPRV